MDIMDNQLNYDDPQFVKVLETCLKIEIATAKKELNANMMEIKRLKTVIRIELDKRKQFKEKLMQMDRIRAILSETLTKLYLSISEVSDNLEVIKANADDQYKLIQLRSQEYQDIIAEYKQTWHTYHAMYEKFPLAKARNAAKIKLEKLKIEYMVMTFKKAETTTIIKQKRHIDWIRTRGKIIEFAAVMVERLKLEEKLMKLKVNVNYHRRELHSIEVELQVLRKKEEDQRTLRKQKMLEMAPPKINIPYRGIYVQNRTHKKAQEWKQITESFDADSISVNTLALEELCINTISPEIIDVEMEQENNPKFTAVQEKNISNLESTVCSEKNNIRAASVTPDVEASAEKMDLTDNDVEMKKTHEQETQESHETIKAQPSFRTKENSLKHSAPKNTQNEVQAKRIRLQREDSNRGSSKITAPQQSVIVKKVDLRSPPTSFPKIRSIESVHYNVMPITSKPVQRNAVATSSNFSHYEYCDSEMSFDQISKGPPSLYDGSLCNYKLSPASNISSMYIDEDTRMTSPPKRTLQEDKKQADDGTSLFHFSNFLKKTKNDFTYFE